MTDRDLHELLEPIQPFLPRTAWWKVVEKLYDRQRETFEVLKSSEVLRKTAAHRFFLGGKFFDAFSEFACQSTEPADPSVVTTNDSGVHQQPFPMARRPQRPGNDGRFRIPFLRSVRAFFRNGRQIGKQFALWRNPCSLIWRSVLLLKIRHLPERQILTEA